MKKRYVFVLIFSLVILITVFRLLKIGGSLIAENVSFTYVERGSFRQEYRTNAIITGANHHYYFNGLVSDCKHEINDFVESDEILLTYINSENKKTELKSSVSGYITDISGGKVTVCDLSYSLICYLPSDKFDLVKEGSECLFEYGTVIYPATVVSKKDLGERRAGQTVYQITLVPEKREHLKLNRQGNLTIPLETVNDVLKVDRKALLEDAQGCYLLDENWIDDMDHPEKYRISVEVIMADETTAVVSGAGVENRKVCIMDDRLKAVLND